MQGDRFLREFSHLGEVRSITPEHVSVMALTATATVSTRKEIIKSLDMQILLLCQCPQRKHLLCISNEAE